MAAFQSGGKLVIVVLNQGGASKQSISIKGGSVSSLTAYVFNVADNEQRIQLCTKLVNLILRDQRIKIFEYF